MGNPSKSVDVLPARIPSASGKSRVARLRVLRVVLPILVLAAALAVSYYVWEKERRNIEQVMQADFDTRVREAVDIFRERMLAYEQVLHAINGLFASSRNIERDEFHTFTTNLRIEEHPGLQGVGYSALTPATNRRPNAASLRAKGSGTGATQSEEVPVVHTAVSYFEPAATADPGSLGWDYFAEPSRRYAMELARDSNNVAVSNKVKLPDEDARNIQAGFRMYLPVFKNGAARSTLADRRANIVGWIFASFSMDGLVDNILGERADIALDVQDGGDALDDELSMDTSHDRVGGESSVTLFSASRRVEVGGYTWTVSARSLPNFTTPIAISKLQLIARVGGIASVLLALFTWFLMTGRIRDLRIAEELYAAKENAEAANRAKSQFLAAASHDLRQPTHALGLFIAALQALAQRPNLKGADVAHIATRLQAALTGLGQLLNGLLDVSRLDAGAVKVSKQAVSLQAELTSIAEAFSGPAEAKGLQFKTRLPSSLWVDTDPLLLHQILSNLTANALRYTERGRILIGCRRRVDEVEIQVWDTGIGIAQDQLHKVFEEFYQIDNVSRPDEQGLGLGLAIVQRSAKLLGARLKVASTLNRGSMFSITLPRIDRTIVQRPTLQAAMDIEHHRRTVLVIDDDPAVLDAVQILLSNWGHVVVAASSLEQAVAAATDPMHKIDLILSDYRLAENVTGADAIRAVIAGIGRPVPAVIITGDTAPERIREASASGFRLLHKPLDPQELHALLNDPG